ncbi:C4-dicarboxylate TRAP transporter substrate-binding protein [Acuticoccus kandeliae]|uniref:C4-dicarboxylate TRAP transporter substrate-binding protein n=1 Tax=Acuticoccus kandeliae TaxID=2073160 RepID=UPI0013003AC5|nr:C4-dicarboxylate TRAP transporter substrate-binding protein [Acuticoccus kandeliae]
MTGAVALLAASISVPALAANYNANIFFADSHSLARGPYNEFAKKVAEATDGSVTLKVFTGGSLLPPNASMQGVADGVAQVSYHAGTYTPAELPVNNLIGNIPFYKSDAAVIALASTEFGLTNAAALAEWKKNGIVFGGGYSTAAYNLICSSKVETLADVKGKRMRMAGGAWTRFAEHVGAVPVSVPSSEMYIGLDTGSLDCAVTPGDSLVTFSLADVTKSLNTLSVGNYYAGFLWGYNPAFWAGLTADERSALFDQMAYYVVKGSMDNVSDADGAIADAVQAGKLTTVEPDDALKSALADFAAADEAAVIAEAKGRGVDNAEQILADYKALVDKWAGLLEGVDRSDIEAMSELARTEIYGKLDPSTYGVN